MSDAPRTYGILQALSAEAELTDGSLRRQHPEVSDRRPTRTGGASPYDLGLYALAQDHAHALGAYVKRHGAAAGQAGRRGDVYAAAAEVADRVGGEAAVELQVLEVVEELKAALAIGAGVRAVAAVTCPGCECWSLVPARGPMGGWGAACSNLRCAVDGSYRTWSLRRIAEHYVRTSSRAA
ncbi:hypothetical protein [Kitasatospora cineracea]|uniref:Uncharacterized protein n=1 Tax=Kitasatospora cineracea TaxID=88074 RepID=A0A3N4RJY9_9ACTN|nr:hypothetical protein [Kitasatospora cineracea]RPE27219.1 hypothetical protein EDD38_7363 [Kitasatospora cineracea]RPE27350.1 hypothetical protein EDD38_7495 [Kitasatospora cineracea]